MKVTKEKMLSIAKVLVPLVSAGVGLAASYLADKELDEKIDKGVTNKLAELTKNKES